MDGNYAPWGIAAPAEAVTAPVLGRIAVSPPRLEAGRRFWRASQWFAGDTAPPLHLEVQPTRFPVPFVPSLFWRGDSPFAERSLAATEPRTNEGPAVVDRYEPLGVALTRRDLDVSALPYGESIVTASAGPEIQKTLFFLDGRGSWTAPGSGLDTPRYAGTGAPPLTRCVVGFPGP